jgi:hypothetical protein
VLVALDFDPCSQEQPLPFRMISAFLAAFGVSRRAATLPVVMPSAAVICLTTAPARRVMPPARAGLDYVPSQACPP